MAFGLFVFLLAYFALSIVVTVSQVGKPRQPTTPGVAAGSVVFLLFMIVALFIWGGAL